MKPEIKLFLLKIGKYNGDVAPLNKIGYQYSQIIQLIDELIFEGLLIKKNAKVELTETGLLEIDKLNVLLNRRNSNSWIEPELASKITSIDRDFVYLPNKKELSF